MKQGRTLPELAAEIERQAGSKRDFVAPTSLLTMGVGTTVDQILDIVDSPTTPDPQTLQTFLTLDADKKETFPINNLAHRQIADRLQIPYRYYERMLVDAPDLLASNVNRWLHENGSRRMVRTLDNRVRAFLSDRYRPLDNVDLAEALLPILMENEMNMQSCEITDRRLYLKATFPKLQAEIKGSKAVGDVVEAGIVISNSEVGHGSLSIKPMLFRLACLNGMISEDHSLKKYHTGGRKGTDEVAEELLRDETKEAKDRAFWMEAQDLTKAALDGVVFKKQVQAAEKAAGRKIEGNPEDVVEVLAQDSRFSLTEGEQGSVLRHLIDGGDLSQWGLTNAVTRASQDVDSYDEATRLEEMGGKIVEIAPNDWNAISTAGV